MISTSSSSSTAFHTPISVAMLPYNQSFIVSFVCCCFHFLCCESDVEKEKKRLKKKEAISQLGKEVKKVTGSKIVPNHVNQLKRCSKSTTGTGREPYVREWTAIFVLSPLVLNQVGDTDLLQLAF